MIYQHSVMKKQAFCAYQNELRRDSTAERIFHSSIVSCIVQLRGVCEDLFHVPGHNNWSPLLNKIRRKQALTLFGVFRADRGFASEWRFWSYSCSEKCSCLVMLDLHMTFKQISEFRVLTKIRGHAVAAESSKWHPRRKTRECLFGPSIIGSMVSQL